MANGCPEPELQAQAALAASYGKIYFPGRGPQSVLRGAGNLGDRLPYTFSTHIRSDVYAEPALRQLQFPPYLARSIAIVHESRAYAGNEFFASLGEHSVTIARSLNYEVLLNETVERPPASNSGFDVTRLEQSIARAVSLRADILLLVMRGPEYTAALSKLRALRREQTLAGDAHTFKAIWWQGVGWNGNCVNLGGNCSHALGGEQMSRIEALDAYGDALLDGYSYRWLKSSRHLSEPIVSYTDKPDGAAIPSIVAQALQMTFRNRLLRNATRPLSDPTNYALLLQTLRSGLEVARTFYGAVRFDAFGQNSGKEATTMQMDPAAGVSALSSSRSIGACVVRESQACGLGNCIEPFVANQTSAADARDVFQARARIVLPSDMQETGLSSPRPPASCPGRRSAVGGACVLCAAHECGRTARRRRVAAAAGSAATAVAAPAAAHSPHRRRARGASARRRSGCGGLFHKQLRLRRTFGWRTTEGSARRTPSWR